MVVNIQSTAQMQTTSTPAQIQARKQSYGEPGPQVLW